MAKKKDLDLTGGGGGGGGEAPTPTLFNLASKAVSMLNALAQ